VTNDKDFGDLVFRSGMALHGVLLLRLRDESAANRVRVVKSVLERYADRLPGHFHDRDRMEGPNPPRPAAPRQ